MGDKAAPMPRSAWSDLVNLIRPEAQAAAPPDPWTGRVVTEYEPNTFSAWLTGTPRVKSAVYPEPNPEPIKRLTINN